MYELEADALVGDAMSDMASVMSLESGTAYTSQENLLASVAKLTKQQLHTMTSGQMKDLLKVRCTSPLLFISSIGRTSNNQLKLLIPLQFNWLDTLPLFLICM